MAWESAEGEGETAQAHMRWLAWIPGRAREELLLSDSGSGISIALADPARLRQPKSSGSPSPSSGAFICIDLPPWDFHPLSQPHKPVLISKALSPEHLYSD